MVTLIGPIHGSLNRTLDVNGFVPPTSRNLRITASPKFGRVPETYHFGLTSKPIGLSKHSLIFKGLDRVNMYQITKLIGMLYSSESSFPDDPGSFDLVSRRLDVLENLLLREDIEELNGSESTLVNPRGHSSPRRTQVSGRTSNYSLDGDTVSVDETDSEDSEGSAGRLEQNYLERGTATSMQARRRLTKITGVSSLVKEYNRLDHQSLQEASTASSSAQAPVARLLHVYSLAAMLRGLPADISAAEAADIRAALPPAVLAGSPRQPAARDRPRPSLPHRLAAALTHRLLAALGEAVRGAGPCLARAARGLRRLDARWGFSRRVVRWAGREGPAGRAVRWAVVGVAEGVVEGFGRGWAGEEERGRRRTRRVRRG